MPATEAVQERLIWLAEAAVAPRLVGANGELTLTGAKEAETLVTALMVRVQVDAVPEHAPPQLVNVYPPAGVSLNVSLVPALTGEGQTELPQVIVPPAEGETEVVMV